MSVSKPSDWRPPLPTDPNQLLGSLAEVLGTVDFGPGELEQRLDEIVESAAAIFDVAGAGLMLVDERSRLRLVGASNEAGRALEEAQEHAGDGPGIEATRQRELVVVSDLSRAGRWGEINRAVAPFGVVSVISAPICLDDEGVGNLNLFARVPREWTQTERTGAVAYARVAAAMLRIALEAQSGDRLVAELSGRMSSGRLGSNDRGLGRDGG